LDVKQEQTTTTAIQSDPSIPKYLLFFIFTLALIICLIKKTKVIKNIHKFNFLIRQIIKIDVKVKIIKYLGI
jgi:succinate-acetate transporter protein